MTLLDDTSSVDEAPERDAVVPAEPTSDRSGAEPAAEPRHADEHPDAGHRDEDHPSEDGHRALRPDPRVDPTGRMPLRGMRIQRVRLVSVAKLAAVFFILGFVVVVGTLVVLWNIVQTMGFVADIEETITTSLGLESFEVDGSALFGVVTVGVGALSALGWLTTILLAAVYNAACTAFGGLAMETGPLQRRRRVFSLRHRRFVTVRS